MEPSVRNRLALALDTQLRDQVGLSLANRAIIAVILLSTLLVVLETEPTIFEPYQGLFSRAETLVLLFFCVEYCLRLWVSIENPDFPSRWAYFKSPVALLDLAVIATMAFSFVGLEGALLRLVRLFRLLRLAKLGQFSAALRNIGEAIAERRNELLVSLLIAMGLLLLSASALYLIEGEHQPEAYGSIPRAMWWSVATLTTVGYGDTIPVTPLGKFFAALTALTGIGLIAMPTGILASAFNAAIRRKDREE